MNDCEVVYVPPEDGERLELELPTLWHIECCDCGLRHKLSFAIEESGKLGIAAERLPAPPDTEEE